MFYTPGPVRDSRRLLDLELLPYGAGTIPFDNARESCEYVERYFPEFPFIPQDFEAEALVIWKGREFPRIKTQEWGPISGEVADFEDYCDRLERTARDLEPLAPHRWLVLDEPVFQSIGTPFFPGNPDLAIETVGAVINSTEISGRWGRTSAGTPTSPSSAVFPSTYSTSTRTLPGTP